MGSWEEETHLFEPGFSFLKMSTSPLAERSPSSLFMSTMATSAPEVTRAWAITRPRPRAPPVTTATLPSIEKEASVRLKCEPPRPTTGFEGGRSFSSGYSTTMSSRVRAYWPSWPPLSPGSPEVVPALTWSSFESLSRRLGDGVKCRSEELAGWAGRNAARGACVVVARATWRMNWDLNIVVESESNWGLVGIYFKLLRFQLNKQL